MNAESDFDAEIKQLLGRALADVPAAPDIASDDIENALRGNHRPRTGRAHKAEREANPWILRGGLVLGAAAAIVGLLLIPNIGTDNAEVVPATLPGSVPTAETVPETPSPEPTTPAPTTAPEEATPTSETLPADTDPAATSAPDTTIAPIPAGLPIDQAPTVALFSSTALVTSGPTGVYVWFPDGDPVAVTNDNASTALFIGDGGVVYQRPAGGPVDPTPQVWNVATRVAEPLNLPNNTGGPVTILDSANVDGEQILLYRTDINRDPALNNENGFPPCIATGEGCDSHLMAYSFTTGEASLVDTINTFETSGWGHLTLASNGVIVGTVIDLIVHGPYSVSLTDAPPVDFAALGQTDSTDCESCPRDYTISGDGTIVVWINGAGADTALEFADLTNPAVTASVSVDAELAGFGELEADILRISDDGTVSGELFRTAGPADQSALHIDPSTSATTSLTAGTRYTLGTVGN